jgi:hypothetical protein
MKPIVDGLAKEYGEQMIFQRYEWRSKKAQALVEDYAITETPTFVILNRAGVPAVIHSGVDSYAGIKALIEKALR